MMTRVVLVAVVALAVGSHATPHRLTYVGYDHVLDYNPEAGTFQAYDFNRTLVSGSTCDSFITPPLISGATLKDAMMAVTNPENAQLTFLGSEKFMVTNGDGGYVIRRCSGFMPQQTSLPCEVYALGKGAEFAYPNTYFYAGPNRVIRYNKDTSAFDVIFYDADVHGGGNPFHTIITGSFASFPTHDLGFAYLNLANDGELFDEYLLVLELASGNFKMWRYSSFAREVDDVLLDQVLDGTFRVGYRIKTMLGNGVVAYNEDNGDYEVWRFKKEDGKITIDVVKSDNIESGIHGCVFHDRQACVQRKGCGWCADSVTCHRLSYPDRTTCDGYKCMMMIDEYSPDYKKYQTAEHPIPMALRQFGDGPGNVTSPLRGTIESAVPIARASDIEDEEMEGGIKVNPSEGVVYIPPVSSDPPCMDDKYVEPQTLPAPDLLGAEDKMNQASGKKLGEVAVLPDWTAFDTTNQQHEPDCDDGLLKAGDDMKAPQPNAHVGVPQPLIGEGGAGYSSPDLPKGTASSANQGYQPMNDGTAKEEDLMNGVRSHFSSLMPKGDNVVAARPQEETAPALPLATGDRQKLNTFKPKDWGTKPKPAKTTKQPTFALTPSDTLYSSGQMELGVVGDVPGGIHNRAPNAKQLSAMANAQYTSTSIYTPSIPMPQDVTNEHRDDLTGARSLETEQLPSRADENIVEGWSVRDVPLAAAQEHVGKGEGVEAPLPPTNAWAANAVADAEDNAAAEHANAVEKNKATELKDKSEAVLYNPSEAVKVQQEGAVEAPSTDSVNFDRH